MKIYRFTNSPSENPFIPKWDYRLLEHKIEDAELIESLRNIILQKEPEILGSTPVPAGDAGNTGLGQQSLTSRFPYFNLFNWADEYKEISELKDIIYDCYKEMMKAFKIKRPKTSIQCWANVMREGESIGMHRHNVSEFAFLSGNICISADGNTGTYYYVIENMPMNEQPQAQYAIKNEPGYLNIFDSKMLHETDTHTGKSERITIAFDIELGDLTHIEERSFILFDEGQIETF